MATIVLDDSNYKRVLQENPIVVVDVWAAWCAPCKRFSPIFEKVANENPNVVFAKVNADQNAAFLSEFKIFSIPTIMAFSGGSIVFRHAGTVQEAILQDIVDRVVRY